MTFGKHREGTTSRCFFILCLDRYDIARVETAQHVVK